MATFRVHRLKDHLRQHFRFAPHVSGTAMVKPRDYELGQEIEAATPYAAFFAMRDSETPLAVGDVLENGASLHIFKFVGFEEARWVIPEQVPVEAASVGVPSEPSSALQ